MNSFRHSFFILLIIWSLIWCGLWEEEERCCTYHSFIHSFFLLFTSSLLLVKKLLAGCNNDVKCGYCTIIRINHRLLIQSSLCSRQWALRHSSLQYLFWIKSFLLKMKMRITIMKIRIHLSITNTISKFFTAYIKKVELQAFGFEHLLAYPLFNQNINNKDN